MYGCIHPISQPILVDEADMMGTVGWVGMNLEMILFYWLLRMNSKVLADRQGLTSVLCEFKMLSGEPVKNDNR